VFEQQTMALAKDDQVRITQNGFDKNGKRLDNGMALTVKAVKKSGHITLQNPISKGVLELDKTFGHLAHGYCSTSHSAQGKAVDEVFIAQPAAIFSATDAKQFYVSDSRGWERCRMYTACQGL
jgi:ATP-dependent exoDNAse (exonuclease V) alpha subunit